MVSKGKGRETHLSLPKQIARLLVWVPEVWNKPGQDIQSRKSLATAADPILPERGEGFQPQPEWPYIFVSLQVHCAFFRIRTVGKPWGQILIHFPEFLLRQEGGLFMFAQGGPELPLYTVPSIRYGKGWEAVSVTGVRGGSPLSWRAVSVWALRSLTHFLRGCWRADRPNTNKKNTPVVSFIKVLTAPRLKQGKARRASSEKSELES